ncbi:MAG: DUF4357 domain-containing protein [Chloroflexia bacterium]|nr:DUF4357 domain-containing protein [Bacteroidales bacterium]NJO92520.1 DUF4357 domain-containing protein [Chloroflexia bacterium]
MTKKSTLVTLITGLFLIFACKSSNNSNANDTANQSDSAALADSAVIQDGGIQIFYNMYLSVEMNTLFKTIDANFNPGMLNPYDKASSYEMSGDKAVNLGVYAVDLSYARAFEQIDYAGNYLKVMHKLATELGIPGDKFYLSVKRIEQNVSNKDSLVKIANELYTVTETYLKDSDRASAAAMVVLGGWTEALFIATNMVDKKKNDVELLERISDQKSSLKNLIELLSKYKDDKNVKPYLDHLTKMTRSFDAFIVDEKNLDATYKQLAEVTSLIQLLRKEIVS